MSSLIRIARQRWMKRAIDEQFAFYRQERAPVDIRQYQLERFNGLWEKYIQSVPYFARQFSSGIVPGEFDSWEAVRQVVLPTDRKTMHSESSNLYDTTHRPHATRSTGGSTSEPIQFPVSRSEIAWTSTDSWLGRKTFSISPGDRLFLLWGHSHLLGSGIRGRFNGYVRKSKDYLLGYHRWSAYNLSQPVLRQAGSELLRFRPKWILGYSSALDLFARANEDRMEEFRKLGLKAVIATGESFPGLESASKIGDVFGCSVAMEYGSVECGVVAHQVPSDAFSNYAKCSAEANDGWSGTGHGKIHFHVFWRNWFIEGVPSGHLPGTYEILLTSLYPRCFPLVRYRIGDLISRDPNFVDFDQTFDRVIGRSNDLIMLSDDSLVHSESFSHAVRECSWIRAFHVVQQKSGIPKLCYVLEPGGRANLTQLRQRLERIHPELKNIELEPANSVPQSIAGKTRTIVREM